MCAFVKNYFSPVVDIPWPSSVPGQCDRIGRRRSAHRFPRGEGIASLRRCGAGAFPGEKDDFPTCSMTQKASQSSPPQRRRDQNHFLPGRVPGRKHISGCKCGICPHKADKLCAQQTASLCRKSPKGFFDSQKGPPKAVLLHQYSLTTPFTRPISSASLPSMGS